MTILIEDVTKKIGTAFTKADDEEVEQVILEAQYQATAYIGKKDITDLPIGDLVDNAVATWAAGLLWNLKLDSKTPGYTEDRRGLTTGDKRIQEAKDMLKPYILSDDEDEDGLPDNIHIFTITGDDEDDEDDLEDIITEDEED